MLAGKKQIIRKENKGDMQYYGCEFIGLAPVLNFIFDDFENNLEKAD